ncbi:MAG TPA: uroporphyrinogen decarboxylase family protein [Armatimonadota bacterium]|jgi:uroporphyrinogen decarboxylase
MAELTPGERVVRCLTGEEIDRVPYGVGIGWSPWGETLENWRVESGVADLNVGEYFGFDRSFAQPEITLGLLPAFAPVVLAETEEFIIHRDARGITKRDRRDGGSMPEFLEYPVKTPEDWEQLKAERLRIDDLARISQDWDQFRARLKETGEAVQVGWFPYGAFGTPRDLMGDEELLVAFYDEPEMVKDMMQHLTALWIALFARVAAEVQIDHIHIWEDMSGRQGSLISPAMVEEFMMPCYDRIRDFGRSAGVRLISVDTDGDCAQLTPVMMRHGVNMMVPFEVQAGCDIHDYRRRYPTLGIMGGLDKRALAGSTAEIDVELAKAAEMVRHGRYVPGFDHLIPPDVSWENYKYAAAQMRKICFGA